MYANVEGPRRRIDSLKLLDDGWYDGKGKKLTQDSVEWLILIQDSFTEGNIPFPYFYPTLEGGARAEWSLNDWEASAEFDPTSKEVLFHAVNLTTCSEVAKTIVNDEIQACINALNK